MSQAVQLPHRPRLAAHAQLRRHVTDGRARAFIFDTQAEEAIEIEERYLTILLGLDGTRDIGGVCLAAAQGGAYRRASEVVAFLAQLQECKLLTDGIAPHGKSATSFPERPLEVLPDFSLWCDANGACCSTYSSVPFSQPDVRRALSLVPEVATRLKEGSGPTSDEDRVFLPMEGSQDTALCTVTLIDGRCAFLADDNRCQVQCAGGAAAKPTGCNVFPATFVDDGSAVRVSVGVECPCVLSSLGREGGSSLQPEGAKTEGELLSGSRIVRLPERIGVAAGKTAMRSELRRWAEAVQGELGQCHDALAGFWSLAESVLEHGLDPDAAKRALATAASPPSAALGFRLMALAAKTRDKRETTAAWRAERDRCRRLSVWLDEAAQALLEPATVAQALIAAVHPNHEAFYLRASVVGHQLVTDELNLVQALRDRATRLLLARQLPHSVPPECADDPAVDYPLSAVEMMMRGQGLHGYALGIS